MRVFALDANNNVVVLATRPEGRTQGPTFSTERELAALVNKWPISRVVEVWNRLPGIKRTIRFASRAIAVQRIWKTLVLLGASVPSESPKSSASHKTGNAPNSARGKKCEIVIALLKRPKGATLHTLMQVTDWQAHTVRGFISGHLRAKLQFKIRSIKHDGERVYAIEG
jgi:hypothetical protein